MESVRNWLEQTIGMPIDYICTSLSGDADTACFDKNCHTWEHGVKKSMARVAMIPKKKSMIPLKKGKRLIVCMKTFLNELPTVFAPM